MNHVRQVFLAMLVAALPLGVLADGLRIGGTGGALGTMKILGDAFVARHPARGPVKILPSLDSAGGVRALLAGVVDIALTSRPLKESEQRPDLEAFEYGRSPFGLVTSKSGVTRLAARDVAGMLSGRIATWPDGEPVRVVLRPLTDSDTTYFGQMAPEIAAALKIAHQRPGMVVAATDQDAATEAESLGGSIGTSTLSILASERRRLHLVAIDDAMPSLQGLASGAYKFYKPFFIVTRQGASDTAREFVAFVRSAEGRALLEANGHVVTR